MREIVHIQAGQCGNQIGAKVSARRESVKFFTDEFACETKSVQKKRTEVPFRKRTPKKRSQISLRLLIHILSARLYLFRLWHTGPTLRLCSSSVDVWVMFFGEKSIFHQLIRDFTVKSKTFAWFASTFGQNILAGADFMTEICEIIASKIR